MSSIEHHDRDAVDPPVGAPQVPAQPETADVRSGAAARVADRASNHGELASTDGAVKDEVVRAPRPGLPGRVRAQTVEAISELRFVAERPSSLRDHVVYARHGEWTTEVEGQRRGAALLHAYLIAIPISTVAYLAVWASSRFTRFVTVLAVAALLATALNTIPVVRWVVPDWATLPHWPPFSWIF